MREEKLSKAEKTRRYIIEQAAPVFNTKGIAGTSISDMTEVTGLTKGSIYGNFENKDEVALAVFDYNFGKVTQFIKAAILEHINAIDRLLVYPHIYSRFLEIPFLKTGCPILNTATEADDTHPALRRRAANALDFWKESIENQVKRGIARGEIKAEADPAEIATVMIFLIEGGVMQAKVVGRDSELKKAMNFLHRYISQWKS